MTSINEVKYKVVGLRMMLQLRTTHHCNAIFYDKIMLSENAIYQSLNKCIDFNNDISQNTY